MKRTISERAAAGLAAYRRAEREAYNASSPMLADCFMEDFSLISNGVPTIRGREAARAFFTELWRHNAAQFDEVIDEEVIEEGSCLLVSGRFQLRITPKDQRSPPIVDRGRFHGVLRLCEDGQYRLWREACTDIGPD